MTSTLFMKTCRNVLCLLCILWVHTAVANNYNLEEVNAQPYVEAIERTGKVAFKRVLRLSFKNSGYMTQLSVDEGDVFQKDQVLASLETSELIEDKNSTYARLLKAKRDVARIEKLIAKNLSSESELDNAKTLVETTRAAYRIAFYNLQRSQIVAPFSGVVLSRMTELGEFQSPGREILEVATLEKNRVVKVALTGNEITQVELGQSVIVELTHLGEVTGTVSRIPAMANAEGNLFTIDVLLPDLDNTTKILAGQLAVVKINAQSGQYVYRLPIDALVAVDDDGKAVLVVKDIVTSKLSRKAFDVYRLDSQYIYLDARKFDDALHIVTRGWQHVRTQE